jgi:hypothetical protein
MKVKLKLGAPGSSRFLDKSGFERSKRSLSFDSQQQDSYIPTQHEGRQLMGRWNVVVGIILLAAVGTPLMQSQTPGKVRLSLDQTKPIVYIEFDHGGPREQVEDGEPAVGIWLRLVNNSISPIDVETIATATKAKLMLLPDVITPIEGTIPRSGPSHEKKPAGYASGMGVVRTIAPGKDLIFSVPRNHVSPSWYMQVPFKFSLPPVKEGVQPICYAEFTWEDVPETHRTGEH